MRTGSESVRRSPYDWPALSIKQPWAQLILEGAKDVEVRSWSTSYRGPVWIHTGKKVDAHATERFGRTGLFTGGLVGSANLYGIRPMSASSWDAWRERHLDSARFNEELAKYGWILRSAVLLTPAIPAKGKRGLFFLDESLLGRIERHPDAARTLGITNAAFGQ